MCNSIGLGKNVLAPSSVDIFIIFKITIIKNTIFITIIFTVYVYCFKLLFILLYKEAVMAQRHIIL